MVIAKKFHSVKPFGYDHSPVANLYLFKELITQ